MKKLISIITPMYNEEENIDRYFSEMNRVLKQYEKKYRFEFVITDNCSTDGTFAALAEAAKKDKRVRAFRLSRNYGYQKSIWTGYSRAKGDAAIEFDADLQDSPELLGEFFSRWERGSKIVYGIRKKRAEHFLVTHLRKFFYRVLAKISESNLPVDVGDFLLLDRQIIDVLRSYDSQSPYLRGFIFSLGFKSAGFEYERKARIKGVSKFPIARCISLAVDGIISQSIVPLRIASFVGIIISCCTILLCFVYAWVKVFTKVEMPTGFTTTVILILFSTSLNALFLGIIGEYIARIYKQVHSLPVTLVEESTDAPRRR